MIIRHLGDDEQRISMVREVITKMYLDSLYVSLRDRKFDVYGELWAEIYGDHKISFVKMLWLHVDNSVGNVVRKVANKVMGK